MRCLAALRRALKPALDWPSFAQGVLRRARKPPPRPWMARPRPLRPGPRQPPAEKAPPTCQTIAPIDIDGAFILTTRGEGAQQRHRRAGRGAQHAPLSEATWHTARGVRNDRSPQHEAVASVALRASTAQGHPRQHRLSRRVRRSLLQRPVRAPPEAHRGACIHKRRRMLPRRRPRGLPPPKLRAQRYGSHQPRAPPEVPRGLRRLATRAYALVGREVRAARRRGRPPHARALPKPRDGLPPCTGHLALC